MEAEVFLDTSYAIALAAASDQLHAKAIDLSEQLQAEATRLVTTQAVLLEIGNALAKQRYRSAAVKMLAALEADPMVTLISLTEELYRKAFRLYQDRPDKEWGLIDCVSFVVMSERGLSEALTADEHFEQAGFKALLRVTSP